MTLRKNVFLGLSVLVPIGPVVAEDVVLVSGVRTPIAPSEMSTAVTVLDEEDLLDRQSFQLVDIIRDVAGISVARTGSIGSQAQVRLRGAEANHVLVLIDGVEVNDPASGDEFLFEHLSSLEVTKIEIIRGPQSALWGSDAVAGVINVITRKGEADLDTTLMIEGGRFDTRRGSASLRGGGEGWRFSLGAASSISEGSNVSRSGNEDDGYENLTVNGSLDFEISSSVRLGMTGRYVDASNDYDPIDWLTGLPTDGDRVGEVTTGQLGIALNVTPDNARLSHKLEANWFTSDNETLVDGLIDGTTEAERQKISYQGTAAIVDGQRFTFAIEREETDFQQTGTATIYGDPNHQQTMTVTGVVLDYVGSFDDLTLTASLRRDDNSDFDDVTTWRAGFSHAFSDDLRLRGSVGKGQKAPSFIDRFGFFADQFLGNPDIAPETSRGFEVGLERRLGEGAGLISATYFQSELEDEIDGFFFDVGSGLFTAVNKDGKSERRGVEIALDYDLSPRFSMRSSYTYIDSKEPDGLGGTREEQRRPKNSFSLGIDYQADNGAGLNVNVSHVGDAKDTFFPPYPDPAEVVVLDAYTLVSVAARYPISEGVEVTARVENALDETYEDVFGFATPGVQGYLGLRARF